MLHVVVRLLVNIQTSAKRSLGFILLHTTHFVPVAVVHLAVDRGDSQEAVSSFRLLFFRFCSLFSKNPLL